MKLHSDFYSGFKVCAKEVSDKFEKSQIKLVQALFQIWFKFEKGQQKSTPVYYSVQHMHSLPPL